MQNIQTLLNDHDACKDAREWAHGKTWQTIYDTCESGEWLTWLLSRSALDLDKRTCVKLAAALANTVRHLMPDASKEALDVAIRYGNDEATDDELKVAAWAAWWTAWAARAAARAVKAVEGAAWWTAWAAEAAAWAVKAVEGAAWVEEAVEAAAVAGGAEAAETARVEAARGARAAIDLQMAPIVREHIPIAVFSINPESIYNNPDNN
jgi:hypothetical protein